MKAAVSAIACLFCVLACSSNGMALDTDFGGHVRAHAGASFFGTDHLIDLSGQSDPYCGITSAVRINSDMYLSDRLSFTLHYEAEASAKDTRRAVSQLPVDFQAFFEDIDSDDTRLFDLASDTRSGSRRFVHRLDRLYASYSGSQALFSIGRQAVTTGNGLMFNPMDIVNPFAPSDVVKDYKTGSDMIVCQFSKGLVSDGSIIIAPRLDTAGDLDADFSSFAVKLKTFLGSKEAGFLHARHYGDDITGVSVSGFAGAAAWRTDLVWTRPAEDNVPGYASLIFNMDRTWVMNDRNWYALVEFYYSGIGEKEICQAMTKPALIKRMGRGDLFHTATRYVGVTVQQEFHPLVSLSATAIVNLDDGSALIQPSVKWNAAQSFDVLAGVNLPVGGTDTEFGGIMDPVSGKNTGLPVQVYIQGTWYF